MGLTFRRGGWVDIFLLCPPHMVCCTKTIGKLHKLMLLPVVWFKNRPLATPIKKQGLPGMFGQWTRQTKQLLGKIEVAWLSQDLRWLELQELQNMQCSLMKETDHDQPLWQITQAHTHKDAWACTWLLQALLFSWGLGSVKNSQTSYHCMTAKSPLNSTRRQEITTKKVS